MGGLSGYLGCHNNMRYSSRLGEMYTEAMYEKLDEIMVKRLVELEVKLRRSSNIVHSSVLHDFPAFLFAFLSIYADTVSNRLCLKYACHGERTVAKADTIRLFAAPVWVDNPLCITVICTSGRSTIAISQGERLV